MADTAQIRLKRKIQHQQLNLLISSIWQTLHTPILIAAAAVSIFASGLLANLPALIQLAILALLTLGFAVSLKSLLQVKWPSTLLAMRVIEQYSGIEHRNISSHDDQLTSEQFSPETKGLWQIHQSQKLLNLPNAKAAPPRSAWRVFDPVALRVLFILAAFCAVMLGHGDFFGNLRNAATLGAAPPPPTLTIDAWLKPPTYTAKPPLLLTSAAMQEKLLKDPEIITPENSNLSIRIQGSAKPRIAFYTPENSEAGDTEIKALNNKSTSDEHGFSSEIALDRPAIVKLFDGDKELQRWQFTTIPDEAPKISIVEEPKTESLGALSVKWASSDDYGVKAIVAEISLADEQENGPGFMNNGVFLFDPPIFKIVMQHPGAKSDQATTTQSLSDHPWAGLFVVMTLTATDAAGQSTTSAPRRFKLPDREFFRPLARAIIEQRKNLIFNPDAAPDVATILGAILAYPREIADRSGLVINLSTIKAHLANAGDTDDVGAAVTALWPIAIAIEDGELADARAQLRDLKAQLERAIREGAPPERIAELTDRMRKAMDKLMDQMRKEAEKRKAQGGQSADGSKTRQITKDQLQKMLDAIEQLNRSGSKDAAQDLLSQLDKLLQNLQPGGSDQAEQGGDQGLQQKMDELSNLMRKQQQLMDETQRLPQPGEGGNQTQKPDSGGGLAEKQGNLSGMLDRLNRELGGNAPGELDGASKNMKEAQGSLQQGGKEDALRQQGDAMRQMQNGAQKLGKKLAEQSQGKSGRDGHDGEAGNNSDDPLGRPRSTRNPGDGPDKNMIPSESSMRRAREILDNLRNRYNDKDMGEGERAYIDRLLKGLY